MSISPLLTSLFMRPRMALSLLLVWTSYLYFAAPVALFAQATQTGNTAQQLVFAGLHSAAMQGQINAIQVDAAGELYLLLNQGDGVRLVKTDNAGNQVLAQAQLGAAGDVGVGLALDPAGKVYITGTTLSSSLAATGGAALGTRTGISTNSFVAGFDAALRPMFVTYTGGSRIAAAGIAATSDAVFVTGIIYASDLPVTSNGVQQTPAFGSTQSGFIERFSSDGSTLVYATYLTGALGSTTPTTIAADPADNAYIAGSTTASGFPTVAALVPNILGDPSGFLTRLDPLGDRYSFSTFVPGAGLTSVALDASTQTLLASGSVSLGQFPVDTVAMPLVPATYQVLLKLPLDGSAVLSGTLLAPGTQSTVAAAPNGEAWVDGTLSAPLLPIATLAGVGSGFAVRVNAQNVIDHSARFGGLPTANPSFASLPINVVALAVDPAGEPVIAGSVQPTASAALLGIESYDLPLRDAPTAALPSAVADAKLALNTCSGSLCSGSAAYLAKLSPTNAAPALSFSVDDAPRIVLRNLGSAAASGLFLTTGNANPATDCGSFLAAGASCNVLLGTGNAAGGNITANASNSTPQTTPFRAFATPANSIVFKPKELDFGIQSAVSPAVSQVITVSNLGPTNQTFTSALDSSARTASPFTESATDCAPGSTPGSKILGPGGMCHITINFAASAVTTGNGFLEADWTIAGEDVLLAGASQSTALGLSSTEIDFGTQIANGLRLPRFLYLSNNSSAAVAHTLLTLGGSPPFSLSSPFSIMDECPTTLQPHSVCRIRIDYLAAQQTSTDSTTLTLDQGLSVLVTGQTMPPASLTGATVNPNLTVSPASVAFTGATVVTGVSNSTQNITISNTGAAAFPLALALTGDFTQKTNCGSTLAGQQSCLVVLAFAPAQPGARQGLLSVTAGAGSSAVNVALSGSATPIIMAPNGMIDFGSAVVGTPALRFFKLSQPFANLSVSAVGPYLGMVVEDVGFGPGQPPASAFTPGVSAACHNCYLGVLFQPTATGLQQGSLLVSSAPGGSAYTVALTGTGTAANGLILTPAVTDFGTVPQHSISAPSQFTLTNLSVDGSAVSVGQPALTGDFALNPGVTGGSPCGGLLSHGASCLVEVDFAPTTTGTRNGTLTFALSGSGGGPQTVQAALSGIGSADPGVALDPTALNFNSVPGPSATQQTVTVTNTSAAKVQVGAASSGSNAFMVSSPCATLTSGASCSVTVIFQPGAAQVFALLTIPVTSSAGGNSQTTSYTVPLSGAYTVGSAALQIVPGQAAYGPAVTSSEGATREFTVNNLTNQSLAVAIAIPRQFVLVGPPCLVLAPNAGCSFQVAFLPLTNGDITGSLIAQATTANGSAPLTGIGYLEGYGIGQGSLTIRGGLIANNVYTFNQVASGQAATQIFTLRNGGSAGTPPITIRRVTSEPPFLSTINCNQPLAAGEICTVSVTYAPSNQGSSGTASPSSLPDQGKLIIESDAATSHNLLNFAGQAGPVPVVSPAPSALLATYSLSQSSLSFAATTVGDISAPQIVTLTNTGSVALHISSLLLPPDFTVVTACATVVSGQSCDLTLTSTPQSAGTHIAALEISSDSATSLEFLSLISTAAPSALVLTPQALDFGSAVVGTPGTLSVQVTNTSAVNAIFQTVTATGDYSVGGTCPAHGGVLTPNASCTVQVVFTPATTGTRPGILSVATSVSTLPLTVSLSGIGIQSNLVTTPGALAFGNVVLGVASNQTVTLANTGSAPITSLMPAATGDYAVSIPCALTTLVPGHSCSVQVTFIPSVLGPRNGTLTASSSDFRSPLLIPLTGAGIQNGGFTLTVNGWPSASVSVPSGKPAAYNLTVMPTLGFAGAVALTCTAVTSALYSTCSITPSTITLMGSPQTSVATIMTLASIRGIGRLEPGRGHVHPGSIGAFVCLLLPGVFGMWRLRRPLRGRLPVLLAFLITACALVAAGCGSGADPSLRYAPAGNYQYLITANSISGVQNSQTVTLDLTITNR